MSRRLSRGDEAGAAHAQNRAAAISLALSAPFVVAFAFIPEPIMRGAFLRGAFTSEAARNAAAVLAAYSIGLTPIVLIRSAVASFQARGDTLTPMLIALFAIAVNVALKFSLYGAHGAAGLAFATSIGAWINFALLVALGRMRGWTRPDATLGASAAASLLGCGGLAMAIVVAEPLIADYARALPRFAEVAQLAALAAIGALVYFALLALGLMALGVRLPRRAAKVL
jgi:putative peptidoglycan lipid II flippase